MPGFPFNRNRDLRPREVSDRLAEPPRAGLQHVERLLTDPPRAVEDTLADDLPRIVREVHEGRRPLPPDVLAKLEERAANPTLTSREVEVMRLVAAGRRDKEIGLALAISSQTVRVHIKNIYAKLEVSDRTEAMSVALRRGIIHID